MEAKAKDKQGASEKESVHLSREGMRTPRPGSSPRGLDWNQEAFQQETWRKEVEMRQMFQKICCHVRLESS